MEKNVIFFDFLRNNVPTVTSEVITFIFIFWIKSSVKITINAMLTDQRIFFHIGFLVKKMKMNVILIGVKNLRYVHYRCTIRYTLRNFQSFFNDLKKFSDVGSSCRMYQRSYFSFFPRLITFCTVWYIKINYIGLR